MLFYWEVFVLTVDSGIHRIKIQKRHRIKRRKEERRVKGEGKCSIGKHQDFKSEALS